MHEVQLRGLLPFDVRRPTTIDEALALKSDLGSVGRPIAGGTDLILEYARREHPTTDTLIDLSGVGDADAIVLTDEAVTIGMLTTHNQIIASDALARVAVPLVQACAEIGSAQLRNRATVVGNIATASPANDTISALRALDAHVLLRSSTSERTVRLADFHTGVRRTVIGDDELIVGVTFKPMTSTQRGVYVKAGLRSAQAISVVHAAVVVTFDDDVVASATIALGSVAPTIVESPTDMLAGAPLSDESISEAAQAAAASVTPIDDVRATAQYRSESVRVIVERALQSVRSTPVPFHGPPLLSKTGSAYAPAGTRAQINGASLNVAETAGLTLLDWLRDVAGPELGTPLTGTKEGCAEGECGACTVQVNGAAVMSCLIPASSVGGTDIVTVEGIGSESLNPIQQAFVDEFAVQCGYCIPGFIVAGASLLDERTDVTSADVVDGLGGNLCRCTGYYKIIDAIVKAGQ